MIPPFDSDTGALPPGIHPAPWNEVVARYAVNAVRSRLLAGLRLALLGLREAGCRRAYLGGSFVTVKAAPGDFDVCWDTTGVHEDRLHFIFLETDNGCELQKQVFGGELYPAHWIADVAGTSYLDFFQQRDQHPVGVIELDVGGVS